MNKLSVYGGTGFIGGTFCNLYSDNVLKIPREERKPLSKNIIYFMEQMLSMQRRMIFVNQVVSILLLKDVQNNYLYHIVKHLILSIVF